MLTLKSSVETMKPNIPVYARGSFLLLLIIISGQSIFAQQKVLSIKEIAGLVQNNLPQMRAYKERAYAASQNINLSKNTMVPEATVGYQAAYTTYNNITGMSYPGLMMPITGPPSVNNNSNFVPGSALALLVKWEPIDFGRRSAAIQKATSAFQLANASYDQALFKQQYAALYTYMDAVYLQQTVINTLANIARVESSLTQSLVLAKEGLRPGIDTTQFQSALAEAKVNYYQAQKAYQLQLEELTRLTGLAENASAIVLSDTMLASAYPRLPDTAGGFAGNPLLRYYQSQEAFSKSSLREIQQSWRPQLDLWGNAYGRGSGVEYNGVVDKSYGWSLSRSNYGAGLQLSFPILQFSQINIRKRQYQYLLRSDQAMVSQAKLDLQKQLESAVINFRQDQQIAEQTTFQVQFAGYAYTGLELSYTSGLIDYTRLTQGQYDLLKASISKARAYLQLWHALLDFAVAKGDMNIFLQQLK